FLAQRRGVDAVAKARRRRPVGEDVAEVGIAARAAHFGAHHAVGAVGDLLDRSAFDRLPERRPARPGLELLAAREQRRVADDAVVRAGLMVVPEASAEGALGRLLAGDRVLLGCEPLAQLGVVDGDLLHTDRLWLVRL